MQSRPMWRLLCSLDRIDSSGHYSIGNLQVVCRFLNRWKNDGNDTEFRRLLALLRSECRVLPLTTWDAASGSLRD